MKKIIVFANTMKKIIVFGKHYEKINSVFGKRPNISSALCSVFLLSCKKKLIEGPEGLTRSVSGNEIHPTLVGPSFVFSIQKTTKIKIMQLIYIIESHFLYIV